jgi:predicted dehydrogenase
MSEKLRWGVLGVAKIATEKVIPAMQRGRHTEVVAIASRDGGRARAAAAALGLPKAYGSYDALLDDPDIDAIYNPLPNHLHVPWTIAAAEHGKHVLCEKPIGLSAAAAQMLIEVRDRTGVGIQEAFMVWTHPQWVRAREIARSGRLGRAHSYMGYFSYHNDDPANIRNVVDYGGGALMDIGCYLLVTSRFVFEAEPHRVLGLIARDPQSGVDTLTSMILDYPSGQAIGTCGTRTVPYQRVHVFGTRGRLEVEIPFNAPPDRPCRLFVDDGRDVFGGGIETIEVDICDQYTVQGDLFAQAVRNGTDVPYPLERTLQNMRIIEAIFRSAENAQWIQLGDYVTT